MVNLIDGLAGQNELVGRSGADVPSSMNFYINGSGAINGTVSMNGIGNSTIYTGGSPFNGGYVVQQLTARTIISGGMWVSASGGLALAAATSVMQPIGVAQSTCQSGATCNVIIRGIVPMIAEGTIVFGNGAMPGAGGGLNCVQPFVAGSGAHYAVLSDAASGTTTAVFVIL